ncbi:hypothetical protein TNCT_500861 [Trichonephila clavata]|uniref:Uncharacterized protein n=1 Tax=Trichonephila clavata TaxID=2740835 RepID=A0A8X6H697_TRICU|nr:hypothetical protein TNCT_500861 [Trichonephila clavata]
MPKAIWLFSECPLYPKHKKGKSKSPQEIRNRHETPQVNTSLIVPGLSFAQIPNSKNQQQMAACGCDPSASTSTKTTQKENPSQKLSISPKRKNQNLLSSKLSWKSKRFLTYSQHYIKKWKNPTIPITQKKNLSV